MKTILIVVLLAFALCAGACSRSKEQPETTAQPTPNAEILRHDAERLQKAVANAAKAAQEKAVAEANASASPTASP